MLGCRSGHRPPTYLSPWILPKMLLRSSTLGICAVWIFAVPVEAAEPKAVLLPEQAVGFVDHYCLDCHDGDAAEGELDLSGFDGTNKIAANSDAWNRVLRRVRDEEMPPSGSDVPEPALRAQFVTWVLQTLHGAACADGISPGPVLLRRLNRSEYAATVRDLLGIFVDVGQALPADGAGGEGFDNARETLFLSPIHAEKYLDAAREAIGYAWKDPRSRERIVIAEPGPDGTAGEAADKVLREFLPRAFRRPVTDEERSTYLALFRAAEEDGDSYDIALQATLEAVLVSPHFLFLFEEPNSEPHPVLLGDHELACRLSYFLWNTMPDRELRRVADEERLNDTVVLREQVRRMLGNEQKSGRRGRSSQEGVRDFAQSFTEQWLGTRALGREFKPDPVVADRYDSELEGGLKYEPILFFQEILTENRSLLTLIDADFTYLNSRLARHYGVRGSFRAQPSRAELRDNSHRGGLLGMGAVLAVSSYPHRTSPVLRGKWILETLLGAPPPPPPPNVPALDEGRPEGATPQTLRARLEQHREDPKCASCHDRIDPLGFGLENYDVLGRWRTEDSGQPIDSHGQLPDGTTFEGPAELKQVLLSRKDDFVRHFTSKMLGYALCRGLTNEDECAVEQIVAQLRQDDYRSHTLILGIVESVPFRYKPGTSGAAVHGEGLRTEENSR